MDLLNGPLPGIAPVLHDLIQPAPLDQTWKLDDLELVRDP